MDFINWLKNLFSKPFTPPEACFDEVDSLGRNFDLGAVEGQVSKSDFPTKSFVVYDPEQKDQLDTDMCVGESGAYTREATEGIKLSGAFAFAQAKKAEGSIQSFGTSPFRVGMALVNTGICEEDMWPIQSNKRDYLANWNKIPSSAYDDAIIHKGKSLWEAKIPWGMTKFEAMLAYLWKFKASNYLIMTGADAHAITEIGFLKAGDNFKDMPGIKNPFDITFREDRLISKDSYDRSSMNYHLGYYKKGYRFFTADEVSQFFTGYMVTDLPRALAELLNKFNNKLVKSDTEDVYLVQNGKKCLFENEEAVWSHGYSLWDEIEHLTPDELALIQNGNPLTFNNGPLKNLVNEIVNSPTVATRLLKK